MTVVVLGDLMLDREILGNVERLCPEAPVPVLAEQSTVDRLGGAGLAALFARRDGHDVVLVAAVAADEAGARLRELLAADGIRLVAMPLHGPTPEKIRLRSGGHLLLRLDRGDGGRCGPVDVLELLDVLASASAILVSDYGRGVTGRPELRAALDDRAGTVPLVWDPHPRGGPPLAGAGLVTPNRAEASSFLPAYVPEASVDRPAVAGDVRIAADTLRRRWAAAAVAVTLGKDGAMVADGTSAPWLVPAPFAAHGDPCGAGDRFASAAALALAAGAGAPEAVRAAVAEATAYVAGGGPMGLSSLEPSTVRGLV
jgi:rfaE bifunctional protein kinase chain/domain